MFPQLLTAAPRVAQMLSQMSGRIGTLGPPGITSRISQIQPPTLSDVMAMPSGGGGVAPPISTDNSMTPNQRVAGGMDMFGPRVATAAPARGPLPAGPPLPMAQAKDPSQVTDVPSEVPTFAPPKPQGSPGAPVDKSGPSPLDTAQWPAGPVGNPNTPGESFWQRNASMMQDPSTGEFIDPQAAQRSQQQQEASGPDLIQKMMSYFNSKNA